jgi:hypothetical protein
MTAIIAPRILPTLGAGFLAVIGLLTLVSRPGRAEKSTECRNQNTSVCETVERCTPNGFELNGTCRWNYSISRSYWAN